MSSKLGKNRINIRSNALHRNPVFKARSHTRYYHPMKKNPDADGYHVLKYGGGRYTSVAWFPTKEQAEQEVNRIMQKGAWSGKPPKIEEFMRSGMRRNPVFKARSVRYRGGQMRDSLVPKKATLEYADERGKHVKLYNTEIVSLNPDGTITLRSGGYMTVTTKRRMNQVASEWGLGFQVYQKKHEWYVTFPNGREVSYYDGITLNLKDNTFTGDMETPRKNPVKGRQFGEGREEQGKYIALQERRDGGWFTLALFKHNQRAFAMRVGKQFHRKHPGKQLRLFG